jgi:hypothetical protein
VQRLESGASHPHRETVRHLLQTLRLSREDTAVIQAAAPPAPRHRTSGAGVSPAAARHELPSALTSFIGLHHRLYPRAPVRTRPTAVSEAASP